MNANFDQLHHITTVNHVAEYCQRTHLLIMASHILLVIWWIAGET